jgi:hypothetical protein
MKILLAVTLAGAIGCSVMGEYHYRARLTKALDAHAENLRWGGGDGLENLRDGRRVTNAQVRAVKFNDDKDKATVRVELEGFQMPQMVLRRWLVEQEWAEKDDGWVLVGEKEVVAKATPTKSAAAN